MSEEPLNENHTPRFLRVMCDELDRLFCFKTSWTYELNSNTEFVPGDTDHEDRIRISPTQLDSLIMTSGVEKRNEQFCYYYVLAHEKAHAHQCRRARAASKVFKTEYNKDSVMYELEADYISGLAWFEADVSAFAERMELKKGKSPPILSPLSKRLDAGDPSLMKFIESIGDKEHGKGEWRYSQFLFGFGKGSIARGAGLGLRDFFTEFLEMAEKEARKLRKGRPPI